MWYNCCWWWGLKKKKAGDCEKNNIKGLGSIVTNKKQKRN